MRILIAPDTFKGSLTATEVAQSLARGIGSEHDVELLPLADGGEGSVDAAIAAGFEAEPIRVEDARGDLHDTTFAFDGETALVEVANTCGLAALGSDLAPLRASTTGLGQAVLAARDLGATRIVIALGGSASTDGGLGLLAALGARFLDGDEREVVASAEALLQLRSIDLSGLDRLDGVELVAATDVGSPLSGGTGAAVVFGPQKGLKPVDVERVDSALAKLVDLFVTAGELGAPEAATTPGAGAAGGTGFACFLLGARLVSGADYFLDLLGFDERAAESDLVVTGEGSLDEQTASGKLVSAVVRRASAMRTAGVPVVAAVGRSTLDSAGTAALGLHRVYALAELSAVPTASDPELSSRLLEQIGRSLVADFGSATAL